jgi:hypothetical protein
MLQCNEARTRAAGKSTCASDYLLAFDQGYIHSMINSSLIGGRGSFSFRDPVGWIQSLRTRYRTAGNRRAVIVAVSISWTTSTNLFWVEGSVKREKAFMEQDVCDVRRCDLQLYDPYHCTVLYRANKVMRIDRSGCSCYVHFRGSNTCVASALGGHRYCTDREVRKNRMCFQG